MKGNWKAWIVAADGMHALAYGVSKKEALEKAEEWLGRAFDPYELSLNRAVCNYGSVVYIEEKGKAPYVDKWLKKDLEWLRLNPWN